MSPLVTVPREPPLTPVAVVGLGPVARALAARLLALPAPALAPLHGAVGAEALLVLGPAEALPWVEGVRYLGRDPAAPALLLPTALTTTVGPALLERALLARFRAAPTPEGVELAGPLAVTFDPWRVLPAGVARRLDRDHLERWAARSA